MAASASTVDHEVAVIGAGGVGKAIGFALADLGVAEIRIFDTDRAKAEHLVRALHESAVQRMKDTIAEAAADEKARRRLAVQIGTPRALDHIGR